MDSALRIVFLGSDIIAQPLLRWLTGEGAAMGHVVGVFTQPDRPVGRGQQVQPNGIKRWAVERELPVFQPEKLTEDVRQELADLRPDVALVMAYGHILRDDFINTPRLGTLNLHASILPKYRGASPIQTAIANGEKETGVSLMRIVRKLDAGPVADVERVRIERTDTALEIEAKLAAACVPLISRGLPRLAAQSLAFQPQDETRATYCRKLTKEDGALDFAAPASELVARINGLFPWPSCTATIARQSVKIGLAEAGEGEGAAGEPPGQVLRADANALVVATGAGELRLLRLQRPGAKMLGAGEFLRGFPVAPGTVLPSTPMTQLVDAKPFPYRRL
jgi:methionyl-tRNA formyltransferase